MPNQFLSADKAYKCKTAKNRKGNHRGRLQSIHVGREDPDSGTGNRCENESQQAEQRAYHDPNGISHRPSPSELVELTGIEPVASWLQTRRSPS
jgi:hypothetical protein